LSIESRRWNGDCVAELRELSDGICQRDDGIVRANCNTFSTIDAFLFDDHGLSISDPDGLGGTHTHTFHPAIALFRINPDGMKILIHFFSV
jgi:hypothetical protein